MKWVVLCIFGTASVLSVPAQPQNALAALQNSADLFQQVLPMAKMVMGGSGDPSSDPVALLTNLMSVGTSGGDHTKEIMQVVEMIGKATGTNFGAFEQLLTQKSSVTPTQLLSMLQDSGLVGAEEMKEVNAAKQQVVDIVCGGDAFGFLLSPEEKAGKVVSIKTISTDVYNDLERIHTHKHSNVTHESRQAKFEAWLESPEFLQVVQGYKDAIARLYNEIPQHIFMALSNKEHQLMNQVNASFVDLSDDLIDVMVALMKAEVPRPDNILTHISEVLGSLEEMMREASVMIGIPFPPGSASKEVMREFGNMQGQMYAALAEFKHEDLVTAMDVLIGKKEGNRVDALQSGLRYSIKTYQEALLIGVDKMSQKLGADAQSFGTLFSRVSNKFRNRTMHAYEKLSAQGPDQELKEDLKLVVNDAAADLAVRNLNDLSKHISGLVVEVADSLARESVNGVAVALNKAVDELSGQSSGSLPEKATAFINKTADEIIVVLSKPNKGDKSVKEIQKKLEQVLREKMTLVSENSKKEVSDAFSHVLDRLDEGILKIKSEMAKELSQNTMAIGKEIGICGGKNELFPLGKK